MKSYTYKIDPKYQYISKSQTCGSAFDCGSEYTSLKIKVDELTDKVDELEKQNNNIKNYFEDARKLINLQRYILVILPIVSLLVIGVVTYYINANNVLVFSLAGFLGVSIFINGIMLPKTIKDLEQKVEKIENKIEKK